MITTVDALEVKNPAGFLVIDGVNGAGKTTLPKRIASYLEEKGKMDTRLMVKNGKDRSIVIRPPSLAENRRFSVDSNYLEVAKNLRSLTGEIEEFDLDWYAKPE